MGEVWRAEHRLLARQAAIKLIRPEVLRSDDSVAEVHERFRREAQTLATMKSRHTIAIFDYGVTAEGIFYYVMELLDGLDFESLVVRYGPLPAARVIRLLGQACASLAEAHDAGMLHRDIKPPNLFVCRAADELDITKLLDFGIVSTLEEPVPRAKRTAIAEIPETPKLTQLGAMLGTPGFMAPEQILGMQLDGRADLYSLGCVAWWLLTGKEVFPRDGGEAKLFHRHIYDPLPSLRAVMTGWLPDALEAVIASCLAKDVDGRPADARALAARLRAIAIPDDYAWTDERAASWWAAYTPPAPLPALPTGEVQVIMPGRTVEQRPLAATDERAIAQTIAGPTASRG
jgi:serine/threonine-protein kinase